jgi:hypothetical protein
MAVIIQPRGGMGSWPVCFTVMVRRRSVMLKRVGGRF